MSVLVICEKPSAARSLASLLGASMRKDGYMEGNGYIVAWCLGHLLELEHAGAYDEKYRKWRYGDLPIIPQSWKRAEIKDKAKQLAVLRDLMNRGDVDTVVNACDAGREGELIFRVVYDFCGCDRPVKRLWISSLEDTAIRAGLENMKDGAAYDNLYSAALCREKADWLVGVNATRLFSVLYGATLGIGRVQSPTLSMLAEREAAIARFVPETFHIPQITAEGFAAQAERMDKETAEAVRAACDGQDAVVVSVDAAEKSAAPPKLYDLTALQRDANKFYGYTAKETLDYAQSLYEKKLITYPRSDSRFLNSGMEQALPVLVNLSALAVGFIRDEAAVVTDNIAEVICDAKVTDHHAVIPTMEIKGVDISALPEGERNVLALVCVRLVCAVHEKHRYEAVTAVLSCGGHTFTANGKTVTQDGWKAIDALLRASLKDRPEDEDEPDETGLPALSENMALPSVSASVHEGKTAPPKRFTEGALLAAMESAGAEDITEDVERKGLGTPATRAAIIEKLVKSALISRRGKSLVPTEKGMNLAAVLPDLIKSPALTAEWENILARIAGGEADADEFLAGIETLTRELTSGNSQPNPAYAHAFADTARPGGATPVGICPRCGAAVREGAKGFFCDDRACGFKLWKDNRFFTNKGKTPDAAMVAALLKDGRVSVSGLISQKTGKAYDADIVMQDTGTAIQFRLDFENGRKTR